MIPNDQNIGEKDPGDLEIGPPEGHDAPSIASPHPWYSRILYGLYALATIAGAIAAWMRDATELAIGAGAIGLVLLWKAAQRVR